MDIHVEKCPHLQKMNNKHIPSTIRVKFWNSENKKKFSKSFQRKYMYVYMCFLFRLQPPSF